ncbi:MAG: MATE family efflux transporter, partial [Lentisphaeria bacterium]|nr:MATE family efflux transporter [Lentisphaeria bacterium]
MIFKNFLRKKSSAPDKEKYTLFTDRDIFRLVVPLFFEQLLFILVGSADTLMVAGLGEASISAVSLVNMFNNCIFSIIFAISTGGAVVVSQYLGARNFTRANESAKQLTAVILTIGLLLLIAGEIFLKEIVQLLYGNLAPDVHKGVLSYFRITLISIPFVAVYGGCAALFRAMNRTKTTMYISFISNIINVVGNALLIYVFCMGVAGAALATLLARIVSVSIILVLITDRTRTVFVDFRQGFRLSWTLVKKILCIGIPGGIENGVFQFGRVLVLGLIATFGTREIAANAVANTLDIFGCLCGSVFSLAVVTVIGRAVGAGDEGQVRYYVGKMMKWAYSAHISWNIIVLALTPLLLLCFSKIDVETRRLAWYLILIHNGLGMIMWPISFVFPNVLRSMNDVKVTMFISVGSMLAVRVGSSYLIADWIHSGVLAVWIAMVFDWIVRSSGFYLR